MNIELFKADLKAAIRATIARLKRSGTVGMSADNLWQCTVSRVATTHGPVGTNAPFVARQLFLEVIESSKSFTSFVI